MQRQGSFSQADYGGKKKQRRRDRPAPAQAGGTIVDATIIAAPSSTKNKRKSRDPEMHQTKKATSGTSG